MFGSSGSRSRWSPAAKVGVLLILCLVLAGAVDLALYISNGHANDSAGFKPVKQSAAVVLTLPNPLLPSGAPTSCAQAATAANPIQAENTCPGTTAWQVNAPQGPQGAIEAFTDPASVDQGGSILLYVNTTAPTYSFSLYRMGWYGGLGGRLVYTSPTLQGVQQPAPLYIASTRTATASNWRDPVQLGIPTSYVSGVYLLKFTSSQHFMRYDLFTVRDDLSHAPILFQSSVFTYQAYNTWGGYSLYHSTAHPTDSSTRAYRVSLDRPYATGWGVGDFAQWEYPAIRWLERQGYDMSYQTDADLNASGQVLAQHNLVIIGGHGEYWSSAMRDHLTAARDQGMSLAFFGANDVYWHVRTEASPLGADRLIDCYKYTTNDPDQANPVLATENWRSPTVGDPENALLGAMYVSTVHPSVPLILAPGASPLLQGTGLMPGDSLPGLVGGEADHVFDNGKTPANLAVLSLSPVKCNSTWCSGDYSTASATLYTAASGARVFDAGTFQWSWGLDDGSFPQVEDPHHVTNTGFQAFNANLIAYLLRQPLPGAASTSAS